MSIPNNEIWVKTSDDSFVQIDSSGFAEEYVGAFKDTETGYYKYRFASDITRVGQYAFSGNVYIKEVILPETITYIGKNAFNGDSGLEKINFPESLYGINSAAFSYCTGLTSLEFKHLVQMDPEAFMGCYNLKNIEWGDSMYRINTRAFYSNNIKGKLDTLKIPNTIGVIEPYAFCNQGIQTIFFYGEYPPQLGVSAFGNNTISTVYIPYAGKDSYQTTLSKEPFASAKHVYFDAPAEPDYNTSIPNNELWVKSEYTPTAPINTSDFNETLISAEKNTDGWDVYTFNSTLTRIGEKAFDGIYHSFTEVIMPDTVTSIGNYAFRGCSTLERIHISNSLTDIGVFAFESCGIASMALPNTVISIGYGAFWWCDKLTNINIPRGITSIEDYTFSNCLVLYDITLPDTITNIGYSAFAYCTNLKKISCMSAVAPIVKQYPSPQNEDATFYYIAEYGTLYYPEGSDYSTWLNTEPYLLGYYHWNSVSQVFPDPDTPDPDTPRFELEYYSLEAPQLGLTTTLDITAVNITDIMVLYPWWATATEKNGYFIIDIAENDGLPRTDVITFIGIAANGERIEQTLTIIQKGIEDMATSIALYKTRLDFPAQGGAQYVQVDYINAATIKDPYCSQSWVTIQQTQQGTATDGDNTIYQRMYKITMEPSKFARQINVKFSCTTANGNEIYTDKFMLYQAAPTENPDDGEGETGIAPFVTVVKVKIDGTPEYSSGANIGVGYENLIPTNPIVDVDWIHLSDGVLDDGVSVYDKVMRYPVTYDANTGAERSGTITWMGADAYGTEYTASTVVTQYGTDTPVDEGMITLKSLSMILPAEGGSDTVVVEYYDAKTIYDPEFVGDWATITEISSTSANGTAFNGTECVVVTKTYRITAQPTIDGRLAKVRFKADINYYDGSYISMEKDNFRVYQLAAGGSDDYMGIVYPFRNNLEFNQKGYATSWGSVKVGYKGVTVLDPTFNVSWMRVASVKDVTYSSKEYDYIYEYEIDVDENLGAERSGTITFSGRNEDGTICSAQVTVKQEKFETPPPIDPEVGEISTNYKGYFKSMDGIIYSVSLITDPKLDQYGTITLAGESPVTVSYTDSKRLFDPIRTSTCTIRVVSKKYLMNMYTGKAQGTQVILRNENTGNIEWCGFLQPNLYNQGYTSEIEEIEFEASDCITSLQYFKYEDYYSTGRASVPFSYVIGDIMDKCKLVNSYYITRKKYNDLYQSKDIQFNNFYIAEHNFFSEEGEPWTLQEVLEETCKFFGYVCFQWGDSIYFMDYDFYNGDNTMHGYRYDKADNWGKTNYIYISDAPNSITVDSYKETGGDMSLDDVFNKVTVNCNYYNIEEILPDLFEDELLTNRIDGDGYFKTRRYGGRANSVLLNETYYRLYDHKNVNSIYYAPVVGTTQHETTATPTDADLKSKHILEDYVGANIVDMIHLNYDEANGKAGETKDWDRYLMISQLNRPWCQGYDAQHNRHWETYNFPIMEFKDLPTVFMDNKQESGRVTKAKNYLVIDAEAAFTGVFEQSFMDDGIAKGFEKTSNQKYDGYTFDMINGNGNKNNVTPTLCFYLEVPQKGWWNGKGWQEAKTWFEVPLEEADYLTELWASFKGVQNTVESNLFIGKAGYKIPLPTAMDSTELLYFAIGMPKRFAHLIADEGGDDTGKAGNAYCFIKDLKISICNLYSSLWEEKDMIYENIIDEENVIEGDEIDLKITTDSGYNYSLSNVAVHTAEGKNELYFKFYNKNMEQLIPEEAIIERYVNQYSTPSIKENVTVDMSFKPYQIITDTYWNKDFVIIGQEIDYKYDRQTINLLQKK